MNGKDVRAVENPISAIFDLAEDVNAQAPKVRKSVRYATIFISIWLIVNFLLVLLFLVARSWLFLLLFLALFVVGILALKWLREISKFFSYYVIRHRIIRSLREEDPVVYVPQGGDSVQRLVYYLASKNPHVNEGLKRSGLFQTQAILRGKSGVMYSFDGYLRIRPSAFWNFFGWGYPGYSLFIKKYDHPPRLLDMQSLRNAILDIASTGNIPPSRIIAVWKAGEDDQLSDEVYEFVTNEVVTFSRRGNRFNTTMEIITESPDGTYDFIPFVTDIDY